MFVYININQLTITINDKMFTIAFNELHPRLHNKSKTMIRKFILNSNQVQWYAYSQR